MSIQIEGVVVQPLKQIRDERGAVFHMLKKTDSLFTEFGEIYFSLVHSGIIKGWHIHKKMTLRYAVVSGLIKLVLYDDRKDSHTRGVVMEIDTGPDNNYSLIVVPPGIWNGFQGIAKEVSIVANCADIPHDPEEIMRIAPFDKRIPYTWKKTT